MNSDPIHFTGDGVERGLRLVGFATAALTVFTVILAIIAVPMMLGTSEDAQRASTSSALTVCRSEARTAVDNAISTALTRNSDLLSTISRLSEATVERNTSNVTGLTSEAEANRVALAQATADLSEATRVYNEAIRLSISSPEKFVSECEN